MNKSTLEAEAVLDSLPTLIVLEQLQSSKVARRDKALAGLVGYRRFRAQEQLQRLMSKNIETVGASVPSLQQPKYDQ
ncbi:hypothetical protein GA0061098_1001121 [Bradyrhizobium shewense]|uniref:Uncharacterized protein n=1 Tax=Bradyrhizobium shewense TaxID=1761772 RepID=A0A1C3TYD2_9BRAD|nr:hypothetical protein [Bradyrhizobium shewense]SCB08276.1 hypothetical protein GA0061098_1001121 [Bradyrhizobium shewense]